jgi:multiple sugar transport system permease protein
MVAIKRKVNKRQRRDEFQGVLFSLLPILGIAIFGLIPMMYSLVLSFGNLTSFEIFEITPVGFDNYIRIFTEDKIFWKAIGNTFYYAFTTVLLSIGLSLILAVFLNRDIKCKKLFRVILFIPYVCSAVALSTMWLWIMDHNYGVLNDLMDILGLERVNWLNNEKTTMPVMILMSVWGGLGFNIILYTASLTSINKSYYEAAQIDGATELRIFFKITFPLISPTTFYLVVMGFIGALQSFANFQIMTPNGRPNNTTWTMVYRVYYYMREANMYEYGKGYASAYGWIVGIIIMLFSFANFKLSSKWVNYD